MHAHIIHTHAQAHALTQSVCTALTPAYAYSRIPVHTCTRHNTGEHSPTYVLCACLLRHLHTHTHTYRCFLTHLHIPSHICTHTHTHSHLLSHMLTQSSTNSFSHIHMHTLIHNHIHPSVAQAQPPPVWQLVLLELHGPGLVWWLLPPLFSLLVPFIFLSHDEHIWRRIYFHPIWKHISPWP